MGILFILIACFMAFWLGKSVVIVKAGSEAVVFRLGKAQDDTIKPGLHIVPWPIYTYRIFNVTITPIDIPITSLISGKGEAGNPLDNRTETKVNLYIRYKITSPVSLVRNLGEEDLEQVLTKQALATVKDCLGKKSLDYYLSKWSGLEKAVEQALNRLVQGGSGKSSKEKDIVEAEDWGVKIYEVNITEMNPAKETVMEALDSVPKAEFERRKTIIEADAKKSADKKNAEAQAYNIKRKAEARALEIKKVTEALGIKENSKDYFIIMRYWDALEKMASSDSTKIMFPAELSNIFGTITPIIEAMKGAKNENR